MKSESNAPELVSCPFCGGEEIWIEPGGQIWRGVKGYSDPQFYHLHHNGQIPTGDGFQTCYVNLRMRTESEAIAAWNTRADLARPRVKPLEWEKTVTKEYPVRFLTNSTCGRYQITEWLDNSGHVICFMEPFGKHIRIDAPSCAGGSEPLKAAAQADFERRIMECLL